MSKHATPQSSSSLSRDNDPRRASYIAFTGRVPFVVDAADLGYLTGFREDENYRQGSYETVDLSVGFLDNDFENPERERFFRRAKNLEPEISVVGDAYSRGDAVELAELAARVEDKIGSEAVVVPKCAEAFDAIPDDVILGVPAGYSDLKPEDYSDPEDWYGRDVHVLGGSPQSQWETIQRLTPGAGGLANFGGGIASDTANLVGLDGNAVFRAAYFGDFWHPESPHWRNADNLTIRGTVRRSLQNMRRFWKSKGVWPEGSDRGRGLVSDPDHAGSGWNCASCGERTTDVEDVYESESGDVVALCSSLCQSRIEIRGEWTPLDPAALSQTHTHQVYAESSE